MGDAIKAWAITSLVLAFLIWGFKGAALLGLIVWVFSAIVAVMVMALLESWFDEDRAIVGMMAVSLILISLSAKLDAPEEKKNTKSQPVYGEVCQQSRFEEHCRDY